MYLDDLIPQHQELGYGELGRHGQLGYEGRRVCVAGTEYSHALSAHGPSRLCFDLEGDNNHFCCQVALNDSAPAQHSSADFFVLADGRVAAVRLGVKAGDAPQALTADIEGARQLQLIVRTPHWAYCHTVWLEPQVLTLAE